MSLPRRQCPARSQLLLRSGNPIFPPASFSAVQTVSWTRGTVWVPPLQQPVPPSSTHSWSESHLHGQTEHPVSSFCWHGAPQLPAWAQKHGEKGSGHEGQGCPPAGKRAEDPLLKPLQPRAAPGRVRAYGWSCLRTDLATVSQTCGTEEQLSRGSPFPPPAPSLSHALGFTSGRWFYPLKKRLQQKSTQCSLSLVRWPGECPRRRQVYTCKAQLPTHRSAVSRPSEESPVCPQPVLSPPRRGRSRAALRPHSSVLPAHRGKPRGRCHPRGSLGSTGGLTAA